VHYPGSVINSAELSITCPKSRPQWMQLCHSL